MSDRELVPMNEFPLASPAGGPWAKAAARMKENAISPATAETGPVPSSVGSGATKQLDGHGEASSLADAGVSSAEGYVAGEGYWQGRDIPEDDRAGFDYLGTVLHHRGVRQDVGGAAVDWLHEVAKAGDALMTHSEAAAHTYDVSRYRFTGEDRPILTHFLNAMARKGATQDEVAALLDVYVDGQARTAKREALAKTAAKKLPDWQQPQAQKRDAAVEAELEQIRNVMRTDRKRYNRDEAMQARYRALVAAGN